MRKFNRFLALGLGLVAAACGDDVTVVQPPEPPPPPPPGIRSVTVAPNGATITAGASLQFTAAVVTDPGAATPTIAWSTTAPATVGSISAAGLFTSVATAPTTSVGITATATSGTSVASGNATLNITAAPTCVIQGVSVSPATATLSPGQSLTAVATVAGTNCTAAQLTNVTWSLASGNPAHVTVGATTGVITVTSAATAGVAVVRATSGVDATKSATIAITIVVPDPATVSIESITYVPPCPPSCSGSIPVNLLNVFGQIEVTANVNAGGQQLSRLDVLIGGQVVASQTFPGTSAPSDPEAAAQAPVQITLSANTAQVRRPGGAGTPFVPVVFNGNQLITLNLYVVGVPVPVASNAVPVVMNNPDAAIAPAALAPDAGATSIVGAGGFTWFTGGLNVSFNYIAFSNRAPATSFASLSAACGTQTGSVTGTPATGLTSTNRWTCAGVEGPRSIAGLGGTTWPAGTVGPDGTPLTAPTLFSAVGSAFNVPIDAAGTLEARWNLITPLPPQVPLPGPTRIDNLAPTVTIVGTVAFNPAFDQNWVRGDYNLTAHVSVTDGGVGVNPAATQARLFVGGVCTSTVVTTPAASGLTESVTNTLAGGAYQICGRGADLLGNAATSGVSNIFGYDNGAPTIRFIGSGGPGVTPPPTGTASNVSPTPNTTIYTIAAPHPTTHVFGIEALDTRSGFHQGPPIAGLPATQTLTRTTAAGTTSCTISGTLPTALSDTWVRSVETPIDCVGAVGPAQVGYWTYSATVTDRAGNVSSAIARNYAADDVAGPNITGVGFAATVYTPDAAAPFGFSANDDLEVIDATLLVTQPVGVSPLATAGLRYPFGVLTPLGTRWDAIFTNVLNGAIASIPNFIFRVDETCSGPNTPYTGCTGLHAVNKVAADYPTGAASLPTAITADVTDVGSNPSNSGPIGPVPMLASQFSPSTGISQPWAAADLITWTGCTGAGCVPAVSATTWRAVHMASTSIVVPFFDRVGLWRVRTVSVAPPVTELVFCGVNFPAPTLTDNGINRFWTYTLSLTAPPAACTGAGFAGPTWVAVAMRGGAALASQPF